MKGFAPSFREGAGFLDMRRALTLSALVLAFAWPGGEARADEPPIRSNAYTVDIFQGPLLAPLRMTGLGGAFAAYAEGVDAIAANAAAPAVREPYSVTWVDYDLSFSFYLPSAFNGTDFDNDGKVGFRYDNFNFLTLGASLQAGRFGIGVLADFEAYDLTPHADDGDPHVTAILAKVHAVAGWSFFDGQLTLGGGVRGVLLSFDALETRDSAPTNVLAMSGVAPEVGVLFRPNWRPWRIGATYRMAVEGRGARTLAPDPDGIARAGGFIVPDVVRLPWEVQLGFALQVGPRPLNPRWIDPQQHKARLIEQIAEERAMRAEGYAAELSLLEDESARREHEEELRHIETELRREEDERLSDASLRYERRVRYWNWPRERITVLGDLLVTGPSENAVSLESFFSQVDKRSGERMTLTPRLGIEGEPVPDYLQTRIGTYIEPSRYAGRAARQHFTFGFDIRLGAWTMFGLAPNQIWRVSGAVDLAPRYRNMGLSIGGWH